VAKSILVRHDSVPQVHSSAGDHDRTCARLWIVGKPLIGILSGFVSLQWPQIPHNRKSGGRPPFCELGSIRVAFFHHGLLFQFSRMTPFFEQNESRLSSWSRVLWLSAILLCGLLIMSRSKADPDLWGHVQYGKEVIRDGHLHPSTTWSYAVEGYPWINHENIAELLLAAADLAAGQTGLLLLKSMLTLLILGLPLWYAHSRGAGLLASAAVTAILAFGISFHWLVRPHMLSYASAAVLIYLLSVGVPGVVAVRPKQAFTGSRWLWLMPVVMCFWTNSHGGYLAGMAILMAWLGLDAIDLLLNRDERLARVVCHHAMLFLACCVGCIINPYGLELHTWMLSSLGRPRPEISEWAPLPLFTVAGLPFWIIALTMVLCVVRTDQPKRWPGFVVLGLLAWQALSHHRHLPFLAIASSYVLAPHLASLANQLFDSITTRSSVRSETMRRPTGVGSLLFAGAVMAMLTVCQYPRQTKLHVDRSFYPVSAMQYMTDHDLGGRVLVTFNWAQYALATFSHVDPESRIAIDGRFRTCYPQAVIDMYFDFILGESPASGRYREPESGPFDPLRALHYESPDLVLLERQRHPEATRTIRLTDEWTMLYQDSLAELWGRASIYDDPESSDWLPTASRHISDDSQEGSVAWPAYPVRRTVALEDRALKGATAYYADLWPRWTRKIWKNRHSHEPARIGQLEDCSNFQ
jgi:hypothetical protein